MNFNLDELIYLKTMLEINRKEVQRKIQYISKREVEGADKEHLEPIKKYLYRQLDNILSIEKKIRDL